MNHHPDALHVLARSPMFQGLDTATRDAMAASLTPARWHKGAIALRPDSVADRFHVILDGRAKGVRQNARSGREVTLFLLGPGDGFCLAGLLDTMPNTLAIQTLDPVTALGGPVARWRGWMETHPDFRRAVYRYTHRRLHELGELASDLALHDTMTRLAHLLLRYCADCMNKPDCGLIGDLPHEELAHMIGTVRVVINRMLAKLKRRGVIATRGGRLRILDLERLLSMAERPPIATYPD